MLRVPAAAVQAAAVRGRLLRLAVDGCLPHGGAGVIVDAGEDGVDLIKEFIVALAQTHAGAQMCIRDRIRSRQRASDERGMSCAAAKIQPYF